MLLMIEAHVFDAWTRPSARAAAAFGWAAVLAGFAAPLFLWLAGLSAVLSAARTERRSHSRAVAVEAVCRRGLELFILAFLFRLQAFIVTPGSHPITLFRVDILNVMGPAVVAAGLIWGLCGAPRLSVGLYGVCAAAVAMLTPVVRNSAWVNALPIWIGWYVRPMGEHTTFTAFPWIGFVFAGAACGLLVASALDPEREKRLNKWLLLCGLTVLAVGLYTASLPSIYQDSSFWTTSPAYFAVRVGIITAAFALLYELATVAGRLGIAAHWLERLGRSSLFVYWIHVELVYGYATWPIHRRLPLWGTSVAFVAFTGLMYAAVALRDRVVVRWHARYFAMKRTLLYDSGMRILLGAIASFTMAAACWLSLMNVLLRGPTYEQQAMVFTLFIVQSAATLAWLTLPKIARWWRYALVAGAFGIIYSGVTAVTLQLSRTPLNPANPTAPHFEGYALIIGFALALQGVLTFVVVRPFSAVAGASGPTLDPHLGN